MATRTGRGAPAALLERGTVLHGEAAVDYDVVGARPTLGVRDAAWIATRMLA